MIDTQVRAENGVHAVLSGKVVAVTGGAAGIGLACVERFANSGASVLMVDIDERGDDEAARLAAEGRDVAFIRLDITDDHDAAAIVTTAVERWGQLDGAYNNAGILGEEGPLEDVDPASFRRVIEIDLIGVYLCMRHQLRHMVANGAGSIVNAASVAGLVGAAQAAYSAAKHGVVGLTKSAAIIYGPSGVRINAVAPGLVETALLQQAPQALIDEVTSRHPIGRLGKPVEVAAAVEWLLSDESGFATGTVLTLDGGYTSV